MTTIEIVRAACPDMSEATAKARATRIQSIALMTYGAFVKLTPHVTDAVEFLGIKKFDKPLTFMTYREIADYYWALSGVPHIEEVGKFLRSWNMKLSEKPENAEQLILPTYVDKPLWEAMRENYIQTFDDLHRPIRLPTRWYRIPATFRKACQSRGLEVKLSDVCNPWISVDRYCPPKPVGISRDIGKAVHALRESRQLSIQQLAEGCGMTEGAAKRLDDGYLKGISVELLITLANFFNVPLDALCGRVPLSKEA